MTPSDTDHDESPDTDHDESPDTDHNERSDTDHDEYPDTDHDPSDADRDPPDTDHDERPPGVNDLDVVLVAAVAENGVIGADGGMPWHYPEDLEHFKETTMGSPVILGRRTYESIRERLGGPLPGRTNVVLSRSDPDVGDAVVAESIEDALATAAETGAETVFVAGGATVYEVLLDRADRLVLTEIHEQYEGDTYFPAWPPGEDWVELRRDDREDLSFVVYERL